MPVRTEQHAKATSWAAQCTWGSRCMCSTDLVVLAPSPGRMEALGTEGVFIPAQDRDEMCRGIRPVSVITESPGVTQEGGSYRISLHMLT